MIKPPAAPLMYMGEERVMQPDFGLTAQDYARHRAGFPDSLFDRLANFGIGKPGQSLVDLGTGTGALARGFARRGCQVVGIDIAKPLLDQARRLDAAEGLRIDYRVARAEETGLPGRSVDVVSAGQCWHWFNRALAAAEAARLLRPGGALVIAHFDWLPINGNVVHATETLIEFYNPDWKLGGGLGLYPEWLRDLVEAGFCGLETFSYDLAVPYTHEDWRGRVRASAGVGGSLSEAEVQAFDKAFAGLLAARYPGEILDVAHRVFAVVARTPVTG
jgi:SAM-dependent methyltransferase